MNESKKKHLWLSFVINKILIANLIANIEGFVPGTKSTKPLLLVQRIVASVLYNSFYEVLKRGTKTYATNDSHLEHEQKPEVRDTDQIDRSLQFQKWKAKKPGEEQPVFRDYMDAELLQLAYKHKINEPITVNSADPGSARKPHGSHVQGLQPHR